MFVPDNTKEYATVEELVEEVKADYEDTPFEPPEKYLIVDFPTGERYAISATLVADRRASHCIKQAGDAPAEARTQMFEREIESALDDDFELLDWARNNMDWSDVSRYAVRILDDSPSLEEQWLDADMSIQGVE